MYRIGQSTDIHQLHPHSGGDRDRKERRHRKRGRAQALPLLRIRQDGDD